MKQLCKVILCFMMLFIFPVSSTYADETTDSENAGLTFEIKMLLDTDRVLDENHSLGKNIKEEFEIGDNYKSYGVMYLDTQERNFLDAGWVNRIRVKTGKSKYTLTYKKRYAIQENDIETALASALADGFSIHDAQFPAEIDWGYSNMTLSFSSDIDVKTKEPPDIEKLERGEAVMMLTDHMPSQEEKDAANLENLQIAGPIEFLRYSGSFEGEEVTIEIWPIPVTDEMQYIVELSTKCMDLEEAAASRDSIIEKLDEMGILIHGDALKTRLILNGMDELKE